MRIENKLPFLKLYTKDMMTIMHSFRGTTRGVLFTLICETWNRRCDWITIDEARSMALSYQVTNKQFDRALIELKRFVAGNIFKFTALDELMEEAKTLSKQNKAKAEQRWAKNKESQMPQQCHTETDS